MADVDSEKDAQPSGGKSAKRARGASFPTMPLGEAVTLVKKIASYGTTHTNAAVASFLGHQTANSGPYRTKVAALKDYGLLTGRGDELTVTPLALELAHPGLDTNPQDSLAVAFRFCKLFSTVYDALPKGRELDVEALTNSALHNHGVSTQAKDAFAKSFVKSGETAGLLESLGDGKIRLSEGPVVGVASDADADGPNEVPLAKPSSGREAPAANRMSASAVVNHSWPINGGAIHFIVESSRPLPATAYGVIGSVIEAGDKLAAMLGTQEVDPDDGGDSV